MATETVEITRQCNVCGGVFGFADLVKTRSALGVAPVCVECDRVRKRRWEHGQDLGWREYREAPDHRIPRRLRRSLERSRAAGVEWDQAWIEALSTALHGVHLPADRESWFDAFKWSSVYWRCAYQQEPFDTCHAMFLHDD